MNKCICVLFLAFAPVLALAQTTTTWGGTVSSNWSDSGNWDNGAPLGAGYTAVINNTSANITLDTTTSIDALNLGMGTLNVTAQTLTLEAPNTSVSPLTLGAAILNINNDGLGNNNGALSFVLDGSGLSYSATATAGAASVININSGTMNIIDNGAGNTLNLTGGGQINLAYIGSGNPPALIAGDSGAGTLNTDFDISGAGYVSHLNLTLSGTVTANSSTGALTLQPSGMLTNNGTLQALGGTLILDTSTYNAPVVNNGNINAGDGSGTSDQITLQTNTVRDSLTNNATGVVNVNDGSSLYVTGAGAASITNNGAINLNSAGDNTAIFLQSLGPNGLSLDLTGTGSLTMSDSFGNQITGSNGNESLINDVGHTIQGGGFIGNLSLTNNGTISDGGTDTGLYIQPTAGGLTNNGAVSLTGFGGAIFDTTYGNVTNSATGTITATGSFIGVYSQGLGGTILNNGSISVDADSELDFNSYSGTFALTGTGSLTLADQASGPLLYAVTGTETLVNGVGHTLNAAGEINGFSLRNYGTLNATADAGTTMKSSDLINFGTVNVSGAGLTYRADGFEFSNAGTISVNNSFIAIDDPHGFGQIIQNDGTITLTDAGLVLEGHNSTFELSGQGTLSLLGAGDSGIEGIGGGLSLINDLGHTITGTGFIAGLSLTNNGSLVATGGSLEIENLANYTAGTISGTGTLSGGSYTSTTNSPLIIDNLGPITTLDASVTLNGAGSLITADGSTDALTSLSTITSNGALTLSGGRSLTLSGISTFTNNGSIQVDAGSILDATAGQFQSLSTSGVLTGNYNIGGTLSFTPQSGSNGLVSTISGAVTLSGAGLITPDGGTTDALTSLTTIDTSGSLTLTGGRSLTLSSSTFTNNGTLEVDANSILDATAGQFQSLGTSGNLTGNYNIGGTFSFTPQSGSNGLVSTISGAVTLNGAGSLITGDGSTDALSQLTTVNGSLTLTGGRSLTLSAIPSLSGSQTFTNNGSIQVDAGSTFDTRAGAFQNVDSSGNLTGAYNIGGTLLYTPQSGAGGITTLNGTLVLSGTGQIEYGPDSGLLNALATLSTNNGTLGLANAANLSVSGGFSNNGQVNVGGASSFKINGVLSNSALVTVDGAGTTLTAAGYSGSGLSEIDVTNGAIADLRTSVQGGFQNLAAVPLGPGGSMLGALLGGNYVVSGTMKIDAADDGSGNPLGINAIGPGTAISLSGNGQILAYATGAALGTNALAQLSQNYGTLQLTNGATLSVNGGDFTNNGTIAIAGIGATGTNSNLTVNGNLLNTNKIELADGGTMLVTGATSNNGTLQLNGFNTKYVSQGGLTMGGSGVITLINGATADFRTNGGFNTFTNLGAGTLAGSPLTGPVTLSDGVLSGGTYNIGGTMLYDATTNGAFGQIQGIAAGTTVTLVNGGQILTGSQAGEDALGSLQENDGTFSLLGSREFLTPDTGIFENAGGANLILETGSLFATNIENDGFVGIDGSSGVNTTQYIQSNGQTALDGILAGQVLLTGGTLSGTGLVDGNLDQEGGTLNPGDAPGILSILGNYTQNSGTLNINFTGRQTPGSDWGVLDVYGEAVLSGEIDAQVVFPNAVNFQLGDVFDILNANGIVTNGTSYVLPTLGSGLQWAEVIVPANGDFSQSLDLDVQAIPSSGAPEPGAWVLLALGLALLWRYKLMHNKLVYEKVLLRAKQQ